MPSTASRLVQVFTTAVLAVPAIADFPLTEEDFFAPMPTVLTASRLLQPLNEAPVAMTVIDRELIDASSALDVVDLLRLVPGFQVARKEGIDAVGTYHGFADDFPRRMQVLVDGRSVYDPGLNGVLWSALPLTIDQIERIEVVRGPNAAAFGSNAVLGTINIITRSPAASEQFRARALTGGADTTRAEFSHAGVHSKLSYRLDASRSRDGGFDNKADDSDSSVLNLQATYRPTLADSLTVRAGVRETDFDSETFRYPRERQFRSNYQQFVWDRTLSFDEDIRLQLYHNAFRSPDVVDVVVDVPPPVPGVVDYSLKTDRYDVELQHRWRPGELWRVSWGAGLRRDAVSGALFDTTDELRRNQVRAFGNVEWRVDTDWVLNAGLMAERYSDLGNFYSPRMAVNWLIDERQTVRASAARAYRVPTFLESRGELVLETPIGSLPVLLGSSAVEAERVNSFEVGYLVEVPTMKGSLDLRIFHNEIKPVVDDAKVEPLDFRRFINAGSLRVNGFEAQAKFRPFAGNLVHLAYAYADASASRIAYIDPAGGLFPRADNPEPNDDKVPEHTLTALVAQDLPRDWQISGTYSYVSEMTWMGEGEDVDTHSRLDVRLSKRFRAASGDWRVALNVHNLLDDAHYEFEPPDFSTGQPGNRMERRVYLELEYLLR